MWNGTPGLDSLRRAFDRNRGDQDAQDTCASWDSSMISDLFADNDNLHEITMVRDAVRGLRREARALDAESEFTSRSCEADIRRYCVLVCGRIIDGEARQLTELDRACLEQVLGFKIDPADFKTIATETPISSAGRIGHLLS
jgi:hypothetical protein